MEKLAKLLIFLFAFATVAFVLLCFKKCWIKGLIAFHHSVDEDSTHIPHVTAHF